MLERKLASTFSRLTLLLVAILVGVTVVKLVTGDKNAVGASGTPRVGIVDADELCNVLGIDDIRRAPSRLGLELQQLAREKDLELITAQPMYVGSQVDLIDVTFEAVERLRGSDD